MIWASGTHRRKSFPSNVLDFEQNRKSDSMLTPVALTIAGSDNSAGAGIQADLKTFIHFRVYWQTVVTCVVAEVPGKVSRIQPVDLEVIRDQLSLSLEYFPVSAIKTGMLFSAQIIDLVCDAIQSRPTALRPTSPWALPMRSFAST